MNFEKNITWIWALIAIAIFIPLLAFHKLKTSNLENLINASFNIAGVLLGFLITLHGILLSVSGSPIMKYLSRHGQMVHITEYLKSAIKNSAVVVLFCLATMIFNWDKVFNQDVTDYIFIFWIVLLSMMLSSAYRFISIFINIIAQQE